MFSHKPGALAKLCRRRKRGSNRGRDDTALTIPETTPKIKFFDGIFREILRFFAKPARNGA